MAFIARKPFLFNGTQYLPGDVVKGFPEEFNRSEGFIHTGFIVEKKDAPKPARKKPVEVKPKTLETVFAEEAGV